MFATQTGWTDQPCYYAIATFGIRRAWLAGPFPTLAEADAVLPRAQRWALRESGDRFAAVYSYEVLRHYNGHQHSILGRLSANIPNDTNEQIVIHPPVARSASPCYS